MLTGGCFCGHLRYEVTGEPFNESICHCSMCRRASGAPFVAWFTVKRGEFHFVGAEPARFASSAQAVRGFCPRCGTSLTFENVQTPDEIDIATASLDDPSAVPPKDHIYTASRVSWIRLCDGLPEFPEAR
jgi:hypothetical protein